MILDDPFVPRLPGSPSDKGKLPEPRFGPVTLEPTQEAVDGIRFDFNDGLRVKVPQAGYRLRFSDLDAGTVLFDQEVAADSLTVSSEKFFIRFRLEIFRRNEPQAIFVHDYQAQSRQVMVQMPLGVLGDTIGWFSYVERFRKKHHCRLVCMMSPEIADLFRDQYPDIRFIDKTETLRFRPYACYYLGLFKVGVDGIPFDFHRTGLHHAAGLILGVDGEEHPPRLGMPGPRPIPDPYVCIAVQSTGQAKYWNYPNGWRTVVAFLKENGYRVLCIDKNAEYGRGSVRNRMPDGAENFTGDLPLRERATLLHYADFFVGLSSGLSWLAWCCHLPVVMISGLTLPGNEFHTPYRVINAKCCHGCWNDPVIDNECNDFFWCPRHKGTERQFECSRLIAPEQVLDAIRRIPAFQEHQRSLEVICP